MPEWPGGTCGAWGQGYPVSTGSSSFCRVGSGFGGCLCSAPNLSRPLPSGSEASAQFRSHTLYPAPDPELPDALAPLGTTLGLILEEWMEGDTRKDPITCYSLFILLFIVCGKWGNHPPSHCSSCTFPLIHPAVPNLPQHTPCIK